MKFFALIILSMISTSAFAADWNNLQRHAESYFRGATELPFIVSRNPLRTKTFHLSSAILRIELSSFENPFRQAAAAGSDLSQTFGLGADDTDYVEMYMYSEFRIYNCSVTFRNSAVVSFENCRTREQGYGQWMPLEDAEF